MESLSSWATLTSRFLFEAKKNHSRLSPKALNLFPSRDASHMRSVVRKHLQKGFTDGAILHLDSAFLKPHIRHLLNEGARVACENQVDVPDEVEMDTISSSLLRSVRKAIKSGAKRGTAAEWKHRQVDVRMHVDLLKSLETVQLNSTSYVPVRERENMSIEDISQRGGRKPSVRNPHLVGQAVLLSRCLDGRSSPSAKHLVQVKLSSLLDTFDQHLGLPDSEQGLPGFEAQEGCVSDRQLTFKSLRQLMDHGASRTPIFWELVCTSSQPSS